ncbi:MAG: RelA/SpoT domain-containing protein [Candidatus Eisenbacteria bacterium]
MQVGLRQRAKRIQGGAWTSQRLKRLPAILTKLRRFSKMNLSQVQDIAGCRAVLGTVPRVRRLVAAYKESGAEHVLHHEKDYVTTPQVSGYRGVHLIYRFRSIPRAEFNNLFVEVQIRSLLQHVWATAVETVDFFQRQTLKTGGGEQSWRRFFALASAAFARIERSPLVPETPEQSSAAYAELVYLEEELDVLRRLASYRQAFGEILAPSASRARIFLLRMVPRSGSDKLQLRVRGYRAAEAERAEADYYRYEQSIRGIRGADVVLVEVRSLAELRQAYPNYFVNTQFFERELRRLLRPRRKRG